MANTQEGTPAKLGNESSPRRKGAASLLACTWATGTGTRCCVPAGDLAARLGASELRLSRVEARLVWPCGVMPYRYAAPSHLSRWHVHQRHARQHALHSLTARYRGGACGVPLSMATGMQALDTLYCFVRPPVQSMLLLDDVVRTGEHLSEVKDVYQPARHADRRSPAWRKQRAAAG